MTKETFSDGVLVYDRYYCSKPHTPLLVIKKILLGVTFCVFSMLFILSEYGFPVSLLEMSAVCAAACGGFSLLFVFVKKRFAIPAFVLISASVIWYTKEKLLPKLTYFVDACMLLVEGRFLYPRRYLFHTGEVLDANNPDFVGGVFVGTVILCIVYSLIVSAYLSRKPAVVPAILTFVVLCVPKLLSESLEFSFWLVPALAAFAGLCSIRKSYAGGLAVRHSSSGDYRRRLRHEERSFLKNISSAPFIKRLEMRCNYYSKYFSVGMYCAALTAVCIMTGAAIIQEGGSIDYTSVYEFFENLGSESGISQSPFEDGTASEYFSHGGGEQHDMLNIISPGRGEREIIRVDYTGDRPVYLRGDIGIDFNGTSWTTAVGAEPQIWKASGLKETYRPCESRVIAALLSATEYSSEVSPKDGLPIITSSDVNIEYLCSTNVVFLPPYTAEYSFYNSESFDVYADYAVRVSSEAGSHVNSVQCTALLPSYMSNETHDGDPDGFAVVGNAFESAGCTPNDIYNTVVPEMTEPDILIDYENYVYATYLNLSDEIYEDISEYIERTFSDTLTNINNRFFSGNLTEAQYRYEIASAVAEYLRSNYTYSLDGINSGRNPVMQFLNDTKRGHCSLYASAMTLILRQLGIPARYCTGFYVEGDNGSHSVLLREKNLHAWVEVYMGQYGWVTFDPTSSSAYPGRSAAVTEPDTTSDTDVSSDVPDDVSSLPEKSESDTSLEDDIKEDDESSPDNPLIPEEADKSESSDYTDRIKLLLPLAAVIAAVIVVGVLLLSRIHALKKSARNRLSSLRTGDSTDCARAIYRLILSLLSYCEIDPEKGELPTDFYRRADLKLGTSLSEKSELLAAMEFGRHEVSDEDRDGVYGELEKITAKLRPFKFPGNIRVLKIITRS